MSIQITIKYTFDIRYDQYTGGEDAYIKGFIKWFSFTYPGQDLDVVLNPSSVTVHFIANDHVPFDLGKVHTDYEKIIFCEAYHADCQRILSRFNDILHEYALRFNIVNVKINPVYSIK